MEESENIYDKIQELFGAKPGEFSILEEKIDIDLQMKYFEFSKRMKENLNQDDVLDESDDLFDPKISVNYKKEILSRLASVEKVEAFRKIEQFITITPSELREWSILALQESKMLLESKLLDENKVFISTGLGGKGDKLRYFVVILGKGINSFSETHKKIIRNEFEFTLKKYEGEIEAFRFSEAISTILTVLPLQATIKSVFEEAIEECNQYGDFLLTNFIITNVKELSFDEIKEFFNKQSLTHKIN
jgi:hypothetical protein